MTTFLTCMVDNFLVMCQENRKTKRESKRWTLNAERWWQRQRNWKKAMMDIFHVYSTLEIQRSSRPEATKTKTPFTCLGTYPVYGRPIVSAGNRCPARELNQWNPNSTPFLWICITHYNSWNFFENGSVTFISFLKAFWEISKMVCVWYGLGTRLRVWIRGFQDVGRSPQYLGLCIVMSALASTSTASIQVSGLLVLSKARKEIEVTGDKEEALCGKSWV